MIWNIFKKDLKLLWPLVAIVAATHFLNATLWFLLQQSRNSVGLAQIANYMPVVAAFGIIIVIIAAVHQDILTGDKQDWLVRPIPRRDLVLEKLLFLLLAIHGPMLLADIAHCMATGFAFSESLSAALSRNIYLLLSVSLPIFAVATLASNFIEIVGGAFGILLVIIVTGIVLVSGTREESSFVRMSNGDFMHESWSAIALVAAAIIIPLQYFRRSTKYARIVAFAAVLMLPISTLIPFSSANAFEQWFSSDPGAANSVALAFDPSLGKMTLKPGALNPANSIWLPIKVTGLQSGAFVLNDRAEIRVVGRNGTVLYRGLTVGDAQAMENNDPLTDIDDFSMKPSMGGSEGLHQLVILPRKVVDLARDEPVRLELDYALSLFEINTSDAITAVGGNKRMAKLGFCNTMLNDAGDRVQFRCVGTHELSTCASAVLVNLATKRQNPTEQNCRKYYVPYNAHFIPTAMSYFGARLPVRDPQGLAQYPVDNSQLAGAQVVIKTYKSVAHFNRHLVIPEIHLGAWKAETSVATGAASPQ